MSLRRTGIAYGNGTVQVIKTDALRGMNRLMFVRERVLRALAARPMLVAIEGYAYGARGRSTISLGELGGLIRFEVWARGIDVLEVPPAQLKLYATGRGVGSKTSMVIAARERLGYEGTSDDEADALWLRALAYEVVGAPLVKLPVANLAALRRVEVQPGADPPLEEVSHV